MAALDTFLDTLPDTFDLTTLLDPDVEAIESTVYIKPIIYKYYPHARRAFLARPQVRFSPRESLNDPLEMSRRWRETSAEGLRNYVKDRLDVSIPAAFSNRDLLVSMLAEEFAGKGQVLTPTQMGLVENVLESEAGESFLQNQLKVAQQMVPLMVDVVFAQLEIELDQIVEKVTASSGVLSLTEDALNNQMWAHYADQGRGFVVGFDPKHPFFIHADGSTQRHLLRKVIYTDGRTENFWRNPYYLFLVKATGWAYEKEWRMIRKFTDSNESISTLNPPVHLWNTPPEMIKSIHFGYQYDPNEMSTDMESLLRTGANPAFYRVAVNRAAGVLEEQFIP
jgi:hypothetical protein